MKKKILVVDDELDLVDILCEELNLSGYETYQASNGEQAIEIAIQKRPDAIVSDINMPKLDGLKMLARMNEQGIRIPVILVTAYSDTQKIKEAWKLGAFDFLEKPIHFELLQSLVKNAIEFGVSFKEQSSTQNPKQMTNIQVPIESELLKNLSEQARVEGVSLADFIEKKLK